MMWWTAQNDVLLHRNRRLARTFRLRCLWCLTQSRTLKARWAYDCSRSAKGVEPTIYAKTLLKRSNAVFDELREGIKDIEALADSTCGELRIACPEFLAGGPIPDLDFVQPKLFRSPR